MSEENKLPEGWIWTTISNVAAINPKLDISAFPDSTLVSFVPMAAVEAGTGRIDTSTRRRLDEVKRGFTSFQEEDVLFAKITPCMENGKSAVAHTLLSGIGFGSTEFHVLRSLLGINPQLLYYFVAQESFRQSARAHMTGSAGQLRVPTAFLADTPYPLAPLPEQQRIVSAIEQQFTRLDVGVAALRRVQAKLKRYRAAVLKAAVEGKLTEAWRAEYPTTEPASMLIGSILKERHARWEADLRAKGKDPAKVKYVEPAKPDTESLPELPEGWCWATMEQLTSAVRTICYGILMPKDNVADGVPYVRVKDIKGDRINLEALHKTTPEIAAAYTRASLKNGDLLLAIRGTYGRVAEVPDELSGANITQDTARLDISENVNRNYIAVHLRSPISQKYFQKVSRGVAVKGINIADVKCTPIMLPPYSEQEKIVAEVEERLSIVTQLEAIVEANLKRAERLRQSILKEAFAGRLVPQDPNDEPASVLLERICKERGGWTKGIVGNGRYVKVSDEPVQIDVEGTRQVELWEGVGEASS